LRASSQGLTAGPISATLSQSTPGIRSKRSTRSRRAPNTPRCATPTARSSPAMFQIIQQQPELNTGPLIPSPRRSPGTPAARPQSPACLRCGWPTCACGIPARYRFLKVGWCRPSWSVCGCQFQRSGGYTIRTGSPSGDAVGAASESPLSRVLPSRPVAPEGDCHGRFEKQPRTDCHSGSWPLCIHVLRTRRSLHPVYSAGHIFIAAGEVSPHIRLSPVFFDGG
jgi:hypothetical protein